MNHTFYKIKSKVQKFEGDAPWYFISIKPEDAEEIRRFYSGPRRGFGSIPVNVIVGKTKWHTSIFPNKDKSHMLPLKKSVRIRENITPGDLIEVYLEVRN